MMELGYFVVDLAVVPHLLWKLMVVLSSFFELCQLCTIPEESAVFNNLSGIGTGIGIGKELEKE